MINYVAVYSSILGEGGNIAGAVIELVELIELGDW